MRRKPSRESAGSTERDTSERSASLRSTCEVIIGSVPACSARRCCEGAPLWFSSYVLQLREPMVSLTVENIADFISAYIIGNLLQMAFRFWAFRRWVFPDQFARNPEKALESLTAGGIAEVLEDEIEGGNVTLLRAWRNRRAGRFAQLGDGPDSSDPVSKTS